MLKPEYYPPSIGYEKARWWSTTSSNVNGTDLRRARPNSWREVGIEPAGHIIGIDEKTGEVHDISGTDVLDWWGQMTAKFNQLPPERVRHISVWVGAGLKMKSSSALGNCVSS